MENPLVISLIARDRPGLVESLASVIAKRGGNWLESRMARLGGQFAGILRITVPAEEREALVGELKSLQSAGLNLVILPDESESSTPSGHLLEISLVGQDRPGIVRQISQAFVRSNVNVEELETERSSAPMSGENLFHARAQVQIPPSCSIPALRAELEKVAADLMVDLTLSDVPPEQR